MITNHTRESSQTSLTKSTLLQYAQRKSNHFWTTSLCLHYPTRAEYATIRQPNYIFEQKPAESNILHRETCSSKTLRDCTTDYSNAHRVLKLEVLVRITKIISRLDHHQIYDMHTSVSSQVSYTFVQIRVTEAMFTNHTRECAKPLSRNRRVSNTLNGNAISSEQLVSGCTI